MPFLSQKNAALYLNHELDAKSRPAHNYPFTVGQFDSGRYYMQDRSGIIYPIPDEVDSFFRIWFDIVDRVPLPQETPDPLRRVNKTETCSTSTPYRYNVRVREGATGRWYYVKSYSKGRYTFTRDHTYAKQFCYAVARQHQSRMHPDILNQY